MQQLQSLTAAAVLTRQQRPHSACTVLQNASRNTLQIAISDESPESQHVLRVTWRNGEHHATLCADLRTFEFSVVGSAIADAGQEHSVRWIPRPFGFLMKRTAASVLHASVHKVPPHPALLLG